VQARGLGADPQIALAVGLDLENRFAAQSLDRPGRGMRRGQQEKAAAGADPDPAQLVGAQRREAAGRQIAPHAQGAVEAGRGDVELMRRKGPEGAVRGELEAAKRLAQLAPPPGLAGRVRQRGGLEICLPGPAVASAVDPQRPRPAQRPGRTAPIGHQPGDGGLTALARRAKTQAVPHRQAGRGEGEKAAALPDRERENGGRGQAIGLGEAPQGPSLAAYQALGGPEPQRARGGLGQGADIVRREGRRLLPPQDGEAHAVKAHRAALGGKPQITFARLENLVDGGRGQALLGRPRLMAEGRKRLLGGRRRRARTGSGQQTEDGRQQDAAGRTRGRRQAKESAAGRHGRSWQPARFRAGLLAELYAFPPRCALFPEPPGLLS